MTDAFRSPRILPAGLHSRRQERGYILLSLLLIVALLTIAMAAALVRIGQQIRRDREEELLHRGTAYMRAIQSFHRRLGRYPTRIEELESSNNMRFIRKLYKDPMTKDPATGKEKDFKVVHEMDIGTKSGVGPGQTPGQTNPIGQDGLKEQDGAGNSAGAATSPKPADGLQNQSAGPDGGGDSNPSAPSPADSNSDSGSDDQTFGGGPILGVVSTSTKQSIREFYGKNHYDGWLFIYLQQNDISGQLKGPANLGMPGSALQAPGGMAPPGQSQGNGGQSVTSPTQSSPNATAPTTN